MGVILMKAGMADTKTQKLKGVAQKAVGEYQMATGNKIKGSVNKAKGALNETIAVAKEKLGKDGEIELDEDLENAL